MYVPALCPCGLRPIAMNSYYGMCAGSIPISKASNYCHVLATALLN